MGLQPLRDTTSGGYKVWSHFEIYFLLLTRWNTKLQWGHSHLPEWWIVGDCHWGAIKLKVRLTFTFFTSGADMAADQAPTRRCANKDVSAETAVCLWSSDRLQTEDTMTFSFSGGGGGGMGWDFFFFFSAEIYPVGLTQLLFHQEFPSSETPAIVS